MCKRFLAIPTTPACCRPWAWSPAGPRPTGSPWAPSLCGVVSLLTPAQMQTKTIVKHGINQQEVHSGVPGLSMLVLERACY